MASPWLAPALLRWQDVRWYEVLYGVDAGDGGIARTPFDVEAAAVIRSPGPTRRLLDKQPREAGVPLAYKVMAWWARRVEGQSEAAVSQWWRERYRDMTHRTRAVMDGADPSRCARCASKLRQGFAEVQ